MQTYRGFWIICRSCKFPIRLPDQKRILVAQHPAGHQDLLACPVCANVHVYLAETLERTQFRTPDPFRRSAAIVYLVKFHCAVRSCRSEAAVRAVAATSISVAQLLGIWKFWKLHARCEAGHTLRVPNVSDWVVLRQA